MSRIPTICLLGVATPTTQLDLRHVKTV